MRETAVVYYGYRNSIFAIFAQKKFISSFTNSIMSANLPGVPFFTHIRVLLEY